MEETTVQPSTASGTRPARPSGEVTGATAEEIIEAICEFSQSVPRFTTGLAAADDLVYSDGFAFLLACCLDRGMRSEIIWRVPYYLKRELGHLELVRVARMSIEELRQTLGRLPEKLRYKHDAPYTISQLAEIIARDFGGRPESIWEGRSPRDVIRTLRRIRGVDTIANMAVNLLHRYLGVKFRFEELCHIDVKPDVHVERVFQRTGLMDRAGRSVEIARRLKSSHPAALDLGSWEIGRRWCYAISPDHDRCPLSAICPRRNAR
jgi:endonuclease III